MGFARPQTTNAALAAAFAGLAFLGPAAVACADSQQSPDQPERPPGQTQWSRNSHGIPYPVEGWKSCAEALAHAATPVFRSDPGYNPELDPTHSGLECA